MRCQTIIAGIGGQGVLFTTKVFIEMAHRRNVPVLGSQTFGMAQRGGSVMTHLKIGQFNSPLVCEGDADLLLGLDCLEAHRTLPYLSGKKNGHAAVCVVNAPDTQAFPDRRVAGLLNDMQVAVYTCNADAVALQMFNPMVANLVLLGFGSSRPHFPFSYEEVHEATETLSRRDHRAANLAALEQGRML